MPELEILIAGYDAVMQPAEVLLNDVKGRSDRFHVWAGLDMIAAARSVAVDFHSMRLAVE